MSKKAFEKIKRGLRDAKKVIDAGLPTTEDVRGILAEHKSPLAGMTTGQFRAIRDGEEPQVMAGSPHFDPATVEAVADAWASSDGRGEQFRAGKNAKSIFEEPGGYYSGYTADARHLMKRLFDLGFIIVPGGQRVLKNPTSSLTSNLPPHQRE